MVSVKSESQRSYYHLYSYVTGKIYTQSTSDLEKEKLGLKQVYEKVHQYFEGLLSASFPLGTE